MTLLYDNDGFIIGEKRLKELKGNVANIDTTTQEILSILTNTYATQQSHAHQKNKLLDKLLDTHKPTAKTPSVIPTAQTATPHHTDNIAVTNTDTATQEATETVELRSSTPKQHNNTLNIGRKLTATPIKSEPKTQDDGKLTQALKATTDIIGALSVNSQNISPEIDALHEIKDTISPAYHIFKGMRQGVGNLFKKKSKDIPLPKEQKKHHKQTNTHNKETRRLYRLILQKLIGSSLKFLALKGLGGNVWLSGSKKDKIHDKHGKNKHPKNPTNTKKGGKLGMLWTGVLATLGGLLPFLDSNSSENAKQADNSYEQNATNQPKDSNNLSKLAAATGVGTVLATITTAMINPANIPLALLVGGMTGLGLTVAISGVMEPYLGRVSDGVYHLWQDAKTTTNAGVDKFINLAKKAHNFSQLFTTTVWELSKSATTKSIKGLLSIFNVGKQGLFFVVDYVVRGMMALLPNFSLPANYFTQSFGDLGPHIEQGFATVGQYMTNMVNNITNTSNYTLVGSAAGNMVSTQEATKMAEYAARHAAKSTLGKCALYVNNAVRSLGYKASGHGKHSARNIINSNKDFVEVAYSADYVPQDGDIMSIDDGGEHGHVAIYNARLGKWVSDFVQHKTRGNTAAANDKSYQKIISGKAKVTIARNVSGNIPMFTQTNNKVGGTNHNTTAKNINTPDDISTLIASESNPSLSSNTINIHNNQSITNMEQNYSTLVAQKSQSPVFWLFKTLMDLGGGHNSTHDNIDIANTQQSAINTPLPIYTNSQKLSMPTVMQPPSIPKKANLPAFNLKLPLFGKFAKPKSQTVINNQKHKDRLPVHTVVGKDSFV